jgi:hypothetical protein
MTTAAVPAPARRRPHLRAGDARLALWPGCLGVGVDEADFRLSVTVPSNGHATVHLPAQTLDAVTEGGQPLTPGNGVLSAHVAGDAAIVEVGSGTYEFVTTGLNRATAMAGLLHVAGRLDRTSTLRDLLANDAVKTVLTQQLGPAFLQSPDLEMVIDMPLVQVAGFAPQLLTPEMLDAIEAALDATV